MNRAAAEDGWRLDGFDGVRRLGDGVQDVWLAVDRRRDRPVTLKAAPVGCGYEARYARERAAARAVRSPGIPRVFGTGTSEGSVWLAREFVPGMTLADWIATRRVAALRGIAPEPGDAEAIARRVVQLARELHGLHAAGWMHGDIKPSNAIARVDGGTSLVDLDSAAPLGGPMAPTGTLLYSPPERFRAARPVATVAADLWSLGLMLWECLTLSHPFDDEPSQVPRRILTRAPRVVGRLPWPLPEHWLAVAEAAMARDPRRRPRSAADFAERLERALRTRRAPVSSAITRGARRGLGRVGWPAGSAAAVVLAVALPWIARAATPGAAWRTTSMWIEQAVAEADALRAAWPEDRAVLQGWLDRHAIDLGRRRDILAARLAESRVGSADRAAMADAVERLDRFLAAPDGTVARVRGQLARLEAVAQRSLVAAAGAWRAAAGRVAADPRFAGFSLVPRFGLEPLGCDPVTGLEEFHHLLSAAPETRPPRRVDGRLRLEPSHGFVLVLVPPGDWLMGEQPHDPSAPLYALGASEYSTPESVRIGAFLIGKHEATAAQWVRLGGAPGGGYDLHGELPPTARDATLPVTRVTWDEARARLLRHGLDLPTDAQWEWAACGGQPLRFAVGGDAATVRERINLMVRDPAGRDRDPDGYRHLAPVDTLATNRFGLHHVDGNVREWCRDLWAAMQPSNPPRAADGLRSPDMRFRCVRGASWCDVLVDRTPRLRHRRDYPPDHSCNDLGVRVLAPWTARESLP